MMMSRLLFFKHKNVDFTQELDGFMWRMNGGQRLGKHPIANAIGHLIKGYEDLKDCDGFMNYNPGSY
jgi:hypothetical protein